VGAVGPKGGEERLSVVLVHNEVVPYRLPVFEEMSKAVDLTVLFCSGVADSRRWTADVSGATFTHRNLRSRRVGLMVMNTGVWRALRQAAPDVYVLVDNHENFTTLTLALLHARARRRPIVLWSEQVPRTREGRKIFASTFPPFVFSLLERMMQIYRRVLYAQSNVIVSKSGAASDDFLDQAGVEREKVISGRQTMPASQLAEVTELPQRFVGVGQYLLYLGYFRPEKGARELVEAFLRAEVGDMSLILAGAGPEERALQELAAGNEKIVFAGYADPTLKASLMAHACALVVPSLYEPWGLVVNESLFYGTPVLHRTSVPAGQLMRQGGGLAFDDDDDLVTCLTRFAQDPELRERLHSEVAAIPRELLADERISAAAILRAIDLAVSNPGATRRHLTARSRTSFVSPRRMD